MHTVPETATGKLFGAGFLENFNRHLECTEKLKNILPTPLSNGDVIKVTSLGSRRHYSKMIVEVGGKQYLVYASVYSKFIKDIVSLMDILSENKVNVAPVLSVYTGPGNWAKYRGGYVVFDFVTGEKADDNYQHKITESIAGNIGRMHSISSATPGYLLGFFPGRKEVIRRYVRCWPDVLQILSKLDNVEWGISKRQLRHWLQEKGAIFTTSGLFRLVHGDLNEGNIIIKEDRQAVLIDYDAMHYGHSGPELFRCLTASYCGPSLEHQLLFLDTYRQSAPKESWLLWENNMAAIAAFGILRQMNAWLRQGQRMLGHHETVKSRKRLGQCLDYWNWLQNIITAFPDGRGDWPSIMSLSIQKQAERAEK